MKISLSMLESFLKQQCDSLRTCMDAAEYKDYIIAMIFIKWANDNFALEQKKYKEKLKNDYPDFSDESLQEELEQSDSDAYSFFIPVEARWKLDELPEIYKANILQKIDEAKERAADESLSKTERENALSKVGEYERLLKWKGFLYCMENVGSALNKGLSRLEAENPKTLGGVLASVNFDKQNGKGTKILSDDLLRSVIQEFNRYTFTPDNFEFPDLLGAAYEYLLKFFADQTKKKGGEFYTPAPIVDLMAKILQPAENASICDPAAGSGGILINMKNFVEARYGNSRNIHICGQELIDGTYKMCKMNMLFHGIVDSNIQLGDTLLNPLHVSNGVLDKFDIVVANPPFSQNYTKTNMKFKERFGYWMNTKKQADFMFVQHMVSILKDNGRMAVVMPHGVLFRGGEENRYRAHLIENGLLECVIGIPAGLFYGTPIAACILVINKSGASSRKGVFFINADREYKEGKNQNILRPEDVEKISYVYQNKIEIERYSRFVKKEDIAENVLAQDGAVKSVSYNCNIRRYVDNTPPAENQDVHAHLHGGIPAIEINALKCMTDCYEGVVKTLFKKVDNKYLNFVKDIQSKECIQKKLFALEGYKSARAEYNALLKSFWDGASREIARLPKSKDVYKLQKKLTLLFAGAMNSKKNPILDEYQSRGAFAQYLEDLKSDYKSIASSGWNASLIPDDVLLKDQAGDILKQLEELKARRAEINELFDEVKKFDEDDCEEVFDAEQYEVLPKKQSQEYKDSRKELKSEEKALQKDIKANEGKIKAYKKDKKTDNSLAISKIEAVIETQKMSLANLNDQINDIDVILKRHETLETEKKKLTSDINATEKALADIAEEARKKISQADAEKLILSIGFEKLSVTINEYLDSHIRKLQKAFEEIYEKYTVTLGMIVDKRDEDVLELNEYLKDLGYVC